MKNQEDLDLVWKALADPNRRTMLDLLRERPRTTGELCSEFAFSRYAVMQHLTVLEKAGLVAVRRQGRYRWNYLNAIPIQRIYERWVSEYEGEWASSLLNLKRLAEETPGAVFMQMHEVHIEQEVAIAAPLQRVFDAFVHDIASWWRAPFLRGGDGAKMVLEPQLGGRLYEDWGEDQGVLLATVNTLMRPTELQFKGALGMAGPVSGVVLVQLAEHDVGTLLTLSHHATGVLDADTQANFDMGWQTLLGMNLREWVEQSREKN